MNCPAGWVLTRHVSGESLDASLETHLSSCVRCAAECASLRNLTAQARNVFVPPTEMNPTARRTIAVRLLAAKPESRFRLTWWRGFVFAGAAALVIVGVGLGRRGHAPPRVELAAARVDRAAPPEAPAPPASRARIRAIGSARFTRVQAPPDDVVRLDHGVITLEVARLLAGERFRVRTDDGEVEVRGTRFQVSAFEGKLTAVSVFSGRVEVRAPGGNHVVLEPGDEWVREAADVAGPHAKTVAVRHHAAVDSSPPPAKAVRASFDQGWSLLREGDAKGAAQLFAELERTVGQGDMAEDALYWRAVATAKAGDRAEAALLFERFLGRFPISSRAGKAAVALGWLYIESGRSADARRAFERAGNDPSPAVQASARQGLERTAP
jgi:TolA-binding protein